MIPFRPVEKRAIVGRSGQLRSTLVLLALTLLCTSLCAGEEKAPLTKLARVATAYANTVGCLFRLDKKNIVEYPADAGVEKTYVALLGLDPQCSGGSAMYHSALITLVADERGGVFVLPEKSFPVVDHDMLPQYMDRLYTKGNALWFSGKEFDRSKDPLCCPSIPVEARVELHDGVWVVSQSSTVRK